MAKKERDRGNSRILSGLLIILIGSALLLERMDFPIPHWVFTWPMILVVVGIFVGMKSGFRDFAWLIMIAIGAFFLMDEIVPWDFEIKRYMWPIAIIGVGALIIFGSRSRSRHERLTERADQRSDGHDEPAKTDSPGFAIGGSSSENFHSEDFIDSVAIFGGIKRVVLSKHFRGADIVNIFGGSELNLTQADFTTAPIMDITQMFGGTKLIVPGDWEVKSEMTAILGGIEDKRPPHASSQSPSKVLILRGTSIFGGIEIKSF